MLSILLADSDPVFMAECAERLRRPSMAGTDPWPGYPVLTGENHAEVWRLLETERPAVLLLDIALPGGDSREFMKRLRQSAEGRDTFVIMTYPVGEITEQQEFADMMLGIDIRLYKPIAPRELPRILKRLLDSVQQAQLTAFVADMHPLLQELFMSPDSDPQDRNPTEKALRLAQSAPEEISTLLKAMLHVRPKGSIDVAALLELLPEEDWPAVVQAAVAALQADPKNETAESFIEIASLQHLQAVHPILADLFLIDTYFEHNYSRYVWRESGERYLDFLTGYLWGRSRPISPTRLQEEYAPLLRQRAFEALLETRHPEALRRACQAAPDLGYSEEYLRAWLHLVDCEQAADGFRQLVPQVVRHLQFPAGYVERQEDAEGWISPTWQTPSPEACTARFGGLLETPCGFCGQTLHHLLTLEPIPAGMGVTTLSRLVLATCLSCEGWEEEILFFQHDAAGWPTAYHRAETLLSPRFPSGPLEEVKVAIVELPRRWRWQEWGVSNGRENLNRLGGHPGWIQNADFPTCPACQNTMPFLMQLDSGLKTEKDSFDWGSGGMGYLFWCDACRISAAMWQCT